MSAFPVRLGLTFALLTGGWLGQWSLERHVQAQGPSQVVPLARPLAALPFELGDWLGVDEEVENKLWLYGDEYVRRKYTHRTRHQDIFVWLVYSGEGEDRGHHPEICLRVAGIAEDPAQRTTLAVDGHAAPVQQYRFGVVGATQWVFYWYYTLPSERLAELTDLQRFYQRLHRRPSSTTLEVFAPERDPEDGNYAREFVKLLDAAIQSHVGPNAVRGSQRKPVAVIRGPETTAEPDRH